MNFTAQLADTSNGAYYSSTTMTIADPAAGILFICVAAILLLAVYAISAWLMGRIFYKAHQATWKAWVPVYNTWVLLKLGEQPGRMALIAFVPFLNIIAAIFLYIAMYNIGLKLGKQGVFGLWAIFLSIVWYAWLAFDDSVWATSPAGIIASPIPTTPVALSPTPTASTSESPVDTQPTSPTPPQA